MEEMSTAAKCLCATCRTRTQINVEAGKMNVGQHVILEISDVSSAFRLYFAIRLVQLPIPSADQDLPWSARN